MTVNLASSARTRKKSSSVLFRPEHPSLTVIQDADVTLAHLPVELVQETAETVYGTGTPIAFDSCTPAVTMTSSGV